MELSIKYGVRTQTVDVADRRVIARVGGGAHRCIEDVPAAVQRAFAYPVGPELDEVVRRGERVLIMTVDHTRPNPSPMLGPLMERIEDIGGKTEIMIGLGNHRPMTDAELDAFIGTHDVHQNASSDPGQWRLGVTANGNPIEVSPVLREFDRRIVVGFIEPHYIAGFSGGRKMVLPGCSSRESITRNHFLTSLHGPQLGRLRGNPVHEDMLQAARAVGVDWICDAVVNPDDSYHVIACGELEAAHWAGVQASERLYAATVPVQADIVICASGGHPYDTDMVQAKKALAPALACVKPGGAVILVGRCERGWGASEPEWRLLHRDTVEQTRADIESGLREGRLEYSWGPCSPGLLFSRVVHDAKARLILVSEVNSQLSDSFVETAPALAEALGMAEERLGPDASIIVIEDGRRAICRVAGSDL